MQLNGIMKILFIIALGGFAAACATTPPPAPPEQPTEEATPPPAMEETQPEVETMQAPTFEQAISDAGDRVFFAFDSSELTPLARRTLEAQAAVLREFPRVTVTIEGHCDERGTREYNLALGDRRANAVKNYLVALGISSNRVGTISYGKERPADPRHNEEAWARNRRGVMVVANLGS